MDREQKSDSYEEIKITELLSVVLKRKKFVLIYVATIVLISYLVNFHLFRPTYEAKATLMVISSEEKNTRVVMSLIRLNLNYLKVFLQINCDQSINHPKIM